jgi:acyl carrier protein
MKIEEFLVIIKENLEIEDTQLTDKTELSSLSEYDSLAIMSIIALVDENFGKKLTAQQLGSITTVRSLMELIGIEKFE